MPVEDPDQDTKLATLRTMQASGASPRVAELVRVRWPAPDGPIYYASVIAEDILTNATLLGQLDGPIDLRFPGNQFLDITHEDGVADDRVDLDFWDGDDELSRLAHTHGEGVRVEIYYYFPDVDLLLSQWWGHLRPPEEADSERFKAYAQSGFRSSLLPLPRRAFFTGCQAVFGGLLTTQAEIDEGDCPYSAHLVGADAGTIVSDDTWLQTTSPGLNWQAVDYDDSAWAAAVEEALIGDAPWSPRPPAFPGASGAKWIWDHDSRASFDLATVYFRKTFVATETGPALLVLSADDSFTAYLNGVIVASGTYWQQSHTAALNLVDGETYVIAVKVQNGTPTNHFALGPGGLVAQLSYGSGLGVGFGNLDPATSLPYTSCPRNNRQACIDRLGDSLSYLAFDTVIESHVVNETKGPNINVTSRGNETNLKRALRVIAGKRHVADMDLLTFTVEPDTKHPEGGSVKTLFAGSEGPVQSLANFKINSNTIAPMHLNVRNGEKRQPPTSFSAQINNYSGTALALGVAQGDFTKATADDLHGECDIEGSKDVRVYADENSYQEKYSTERAWWLLHAMRNKRWGMGYDAARVMVSDFLKLSAWDKEILSFSDADNNHYNGPRCGGFNAELIDRSAQQQITDICLAGRYSLPFYHRGKVRVVPLARAEELFSPAVFTDHAFRSALNRAATDVEFAAWVTALVTAADLSEAAKLTEARARIKSLFDSAEYIARARTDEEYVEDLYRSWFDRPSDQDGFAFWLHNVVVNGRPATIAAFAVSGEFVDRIKEKSVPVFTDASDERNICVDQNQKSTLRRSVVSDAELCNRIVLTFDDEAHQNSQRPLTFEDVPAQLRAGRAFGDTSRRSVEKNYTAFGITEMGEAARLGNLLLHLGEFDEGGTENNLRVTFVTWYLFAVELHKYSIIKVVSSHLTRYGFQYFRIRSIKRMPDLKVEINAQAYPRDYYEQLELQSVAPPLPPTGIIDPPDGPPGLVPFPVVISAGHTNDRIDVHLRLPL